MRLDCRAISLLAGFFLTANLLPGFGQAKEQTAPPPTEVQIPDGTIIQAKLRKDLDATKAKVGDSVELEVLEDVLTEPTATVPRAITTLIPKKARLLGKVTRVESAKERDRVITMSIGFARAEWKGSYASLSAVITGVAPVTVSRYLPSGGTGAVPPVTRQVGVDPVTRQAIYVTVDPTTGQRVASSPSPGAATTSYAQLDSVRVAGWGSLRFSPPYNMPSGTALYVEHLSLESAAEQRDAAAQFDLGLKYHRGDGVPQDYVQAAKWFGRAAEQGLANAQNNLGVMFAVGQGVPQDDVTSYMWFALAAPAMPDKNVANLKRLEARMTPEHIAEGKRRAEEWQKQHPPSH
jgi:Sel1 repeat-containing protein